MCLLIFLISSINKGAKKLVTIWVANVAIAAPNIPANGINKIFNIKLVISPIKHNFFHISAFFQK